MCSPKISRSNVLSFQASPMGNNRGLLAADAAGKPPGSWKTIFFFGLQQIPVDVDFLLYDQLIKYLKKVHLILKILVETADGNPACSAMAVTRLRNEWAEPVTGRIDNPFLLLWALKNILRHRIPPFTGNHNAGNRRELLPAAICYNSGELANMTIFI